MGSLLTTRTTLASRIFQYPRIALEVTYCAPHDSAGSWFEKRLNKKFWNDDGSLGGRILAKI
jgi:hypothetical protein